MDQVRQGDVLLIAVPEERPVGLSPQQEVVLAYGESTGHAHRVLGEEVYTWEAEGQRYVQVAGGPGFQVHEDHDPVPTPTLDPGVTYRVVPQQEWDLAGQWRRVQD